MLIGQGVMALERPEKERFERQEEIVIGLTKYTNKYQRASTNLCFLLQMRVNISSRNVDYCDDELTITIAEFCK